MLSRVETGVVLATPIGGLLVGVSDGAVVRVGFGARAADPAAELDPLLSRALAELRGYFAGERTEFTVPTRFTTGSPFERAVWERIAQIPYGQMLTYGEIARAIGEPGGARAVGAACGRNPVPVLVPCHRVVAANGRLGGFGGGLPRKRQLLQLEARVALSSPLQP